jgi:hypothetical protein
MRTYAVFSPNIEQLFTLSLSKGILKFEHSFTLSLSKGILKFEHSFTLSLSKGIPSKCWQ